MHKLIQIRPVLSPRVPALRASLSFLVLSLLAGAPTAFAATRVTSIEVTATVVAGCQVAPGASAAVAPVSVNCSMPVPYQMNVNGSTALEISGRSSNGAVVAGLPLSAPGHAAGPAAKNDTAQAADSDHGLAELAALAETQETIPAANNSSDGTDTHSVRVTIVY